MVYCVYFHRFYIFKAVRCYLVTPGSIFCDEFFILQLRFAIFQTNIASQTLTLMQGFEAEYN